MPVPRIPLATIPPPAFLHGPDGRIPKSRGPSGRAIKDCPGTAKVLAGHPKEAVS